VATPEYDDREHPARSCDVAGTRAGGTRGRQWDRRFGDALVAAVTPTCGIDLRPIAQRDAVDPVAAPPTTTSSIDSGSDRNR
jgi:hypothetical protein